MKRFRRHRNSSAFTLIEVTLCIGLLAFTMIPLVTLLGIGLQVEQEAREQGAAGRIIAATTASLLLATETSGEYFAAAPLDEADPEVSWQPGASATQLGPLYFNQATDFTASAADANYALHLRIDGEAGALQRAVVVVVWPPSATVEWESGADGEIHAEIAGALGSRQDVIHLPRESL